jgi:hypothetical protein
MSGLYAATPYCQHRDCVELARNLPGLAAEAAAEGYSQLREKALHGAAAVHSQLKWEWEALVRTPLLNSPPLLAPAAANACHLHLTGQCLLHSLISLFI